MGLYLFALIVGLVGLGLLLVSLSRGLVPFWLGFVAIVVAFLIQLLATSGSLVHW